MRTKMLLKYYLMLLFVTVSAHYIKSQTRYSNYTTAYKAVNKSNYSNHNSTSVFNNLSSNSYSYNSSTNANNLKLYQPQNEEIGIYYDVSSRVYYDQMFIILNVSQSEINYLLKYYDYEDSYKKWAREKSLHKFGVVAISNEYNRLLKLMKTYNQWMAENTSVQERNAAQYILDHMDYIDISKYAPLDLSIGFKYNPPKAIDKNGLMIDYVFGNILISNKKIFSINK